MPPKHVKKSDKIDAENEKIFLRIMKTRPKVIIESPQPTERFKNPCFPQTA